MERDVSLRLPPEKAYDENRLRKALGIGADDRFIIVRRSVDARRRDVFIDLTCRINPEKPIAEGMSLREADQSRGQVIIVGSGPAGLFAAMTLLEKGIKPIVFERGKEKLAGQKIILYNEPYEIRAANLNRTDRFSIIRFHEKGRDRIIVCFS